MTIVITGVLSLAISSSAQGYLIFFGEDLHNDETTRIPSTPNASAASIQFLANLIGVGTETFETFATDTTAPLMLTFPGAGTATLGGNGEIETIAVGTNGFGRYPISGSNFWEVAAGGMGTFTITFGAPVAAFGFWGVDVGDFGGTLQLDLADAVATSLNVPNTQGSEASTGGSVLFYGFIGQNAAEQFTGITFNLANTTRANDIFAFDDMTIGSLEQVRPVPEPGVLVLLVAALAGVAVGRRRS